MDYQEIDIGDEDPDADIGERLYLVPHDDGASLMFREVEGPEREIFMSTAEVARFAAAAGYVPAAEVERLTQERAASPAYQAWARERDWMRADLAASRARVQQLGEEGRRALRERDEARAELDAADRMVATLEGQRDELYAEVERLRAGILSHRDAGLPTGDEDEALWALVTPSGEEDA